MGKPYNIQALYLWARGAIALQDFSTSVNPILTRGVGADYAQYITIYQPLPAALKVK